MVILVVVVEVAGAVAVKLMKCIISVSKKCVMSTDLTSLFHRCLRIVSNYKRSVASVEYSSVHNHTESVHACDADFTQLLTALEAKLHLWKASNYQWRGPAFQNDCFFELKQALLCNPGNTCAPVLQIFNFIHILLWPT
jgi:hypothetical protein